MSVKRRRDGLEPGMPAKNPVAARFEPVKARTSASGTQIDELNATVIGQAVQAVVLTGAAIMVSHVRTGQAVRVGIFADEERLTYYANTVEELESLFINLREAAESGL